MVLYRAEMQNLDYAYSTKQNALSGMLHRRERYQRILDARQYGNKIVIDVIKKTQDNPNYIYSPYSEDF